MVTKVLIYAHMFAPSIGGAETYVLLLADGLAKQGGADCARSIEVVVVTPTLAAGFDDSSLSFPVVRHPKWLELIRLVRAADVIHLAGPCFLPMLLALLMRKPVVIEHHGYQAACPNGLLFFEPTQAVCPGHFQARRYHKCVKCNRAKVGTAKSLAMLLLTFPRNWMCKLVSRNLPITEHVKRRLNLPRSEVIYYGIPDVASPARSRESPAIDSPALSFAYVGRLVNEKGLPLLIQAAKELHLQDYKFSLNFIGDGPERARLESLTDALGLRERVTFTGFQVGAELQHAVEGIAAVIIPAIWEETAGLAVIEQMMRGRLVIVSDIGGLGEVVDGAGLKFSPGDLQGLISSLRLVLENPSLVAEMGQRARKRALELFSQHRMIEHNIKIYDELMLRGKLSA